MRWIPLLLAVSCCAPTASVREDPPDVPPLCVTSCGMRAHVSADKCEELKETETAALYWYGVHVKAFKRPDSRCLALAGWRVTIHELRAADSKCAPGWLEGASESFAGLCVIGYTRKDSKQIDLIDQDFAHGPFAHEIGHVLDYWFETIKGAHCGWHKRGLTKAIQLVTGSPESVREQFCD